VANPTDGNSAWSQEQLRNARIIISVGVKLGASQRDIRIALMTALVESGLNNVHYGDADSLGLFQQRAAWGSEQQRMDPYESARMFFKGGHAGQRGLFDFADRDQMSLGQAAQAVQVSAYPDRYREQHDEAAGLIQQIGLGGDGPKGPAGTPVPTAKDASAGYQSLLSPAAPEPIAQQLQPTSQTVLGIAPTQAIDSFSEVQSAFMPSFVTPQDFQKATGGTTTGGWRQDLKQYAKQFVGTPYVWGGTSPDGFDCSGFTQYVFKKFGIDLPRISADQGRDGRRVSLDNLRIGDLVLTDNSSRNFGADHVGIYIGNGMVISAPHTGASVMVDHLDSESWQWGVRLHRG
jgi:cell wall-associated NlpC family hydrolase